MILKYKQYTATPDKVAPDRFTLTERKMVTARSDNKHVKKGEQNERDVIIGYGYDFPAVVNKIIRLELARDQSVVTLREYVDAYDGQIKKTMLK